MKKLEEDEDEEDEYVFTINEESFNEARNNKQILESEFSLKTLIEQSDEREDRKAEEMKTINEFL